MAIVLTPSVHRYAAQMHDEAAKMHRREAARLELLGRSESAERERRLAATSRRAAIREWHEAISVPPPLTRKQLVR